MLIFQHLLGSARRWAHLNIGLTILYVSICRPIYGVCYLPIYKVFTSTWHDCSHSFARMPFPFILLVLILQIASTSTSFSFFVKSQRMPSWCRRRCRCQCQCHLMPMPMPTMRQPTSLQEPAMISCPQTPTVMWLDRIRRASNGCCRCCDRTCRCRRCTGSVYPATYGIFLWWVF